MLLICIFLLFLLRNVKIAKMKSVVFLLSACLLFIGCENKSNRNYLNEKDFTKIYFDSVSERYPNVKFSVTGNLTITSTLEEEELSHFLDNAYKEYRQSPNDLGIIITRYINGVYSLFNKKEIDKTRIIPIIKPADYIEELKKLTNNDSTSVVVFQNYNDQLMVVFAEDTDYSLRYINSEDINGLGIDNDTLLTFALNNLRNILPQVNKIEGDNIWGLAAGGNIENSLILLSHLWTKENFPVKGDIVVSIPNRDILLVGDSANKESMVKIKEDTSKLFETGSYPVSNKLFKWNGLSFSLYD